MYYKHSSWTILYILVLVLLVLSRTTDDAFAQIHAVDTIFVSTRTYAGLRNENGTYLTARNATVATDWINAIRVGQAAGFYVYRGYIYALPISLPEGAVIDSAYYMLDGSGDQSTTDFNIIITGAYNIFTADSIPKTEFTKFNGWVASGAYSGIMPLNESWNTASYSSAYNKIYYNSYGRDTLLAKFAAGDTIKHAVISAEDSAASEPTNNEYVSFTPVAGAIQPKLVVHYTYTIKNVYPADSLAFSSLTDSTAVLDSIARNQLDDSEFNKFALYDSSLGMYLDTTQGAPYKKAKTTYRKAAWNNKLYPFPRDYTSKILIQSFAENGTDSSKTTPYTLTLGTPVVSGDTVVVHDTTNVYYYVHDTVTIVIDTMFVLQAAAVHDLISDSIGFARLEWRSDISESLATVQPESLAYANLTGLDSAEFYVMGYDSTTGGTVLRKLKELLSYIGL